MKDKANKVKVWIARDEDGSLYAYSNPPYKFEEHWNLGGFASSLLLDGSIFPEVKWEDDKPSEAYITLAESQEQPKQEHSTKEIDWEQRQYELTKDILLKIYFDKKNTLLYDSDIHSAMSYAKRIIEKLKKQNK